MSYGSRTGLASLVRPESFRVKLLINLIVAFLAIDIMMITLAHQPKLVSQTQAKAAAPTVQDLVGHYLSSCQDQKCVMEASKQMTKDYDPGRAISALVSFRSQRPAGNLGDPHLWAHQVGVETAEKYGMSGETFIKCPDTFNYGCSHGFFESLVLKNHSLKQTIDDICGNFEQNPRYSSKQKYYCYHGAGHGILSDVNYDIDKALSICDSLNSSFGVEGCWQGAFMEADNAANDGDAPQGKFSDKQHPLAPCDRVADKYQNQCYINLPGRLIVVEDNDPVAAARDCLAASEANRKVCFDGLGIVVSNDTWQMQQAEFNNGDLIGNSWKICRQFPKDFVDRCVFGVVAGITNVDQYISDRAVAFCNIVDSNLTSWCFQSLGNDLRGIYSSTSAVEKQCRLAPAAYVDACRKGAGLKQ